MSCASRVVEDPRYSIDRRISVVITRQEASALIVVSPVIRPAPAHAELDKPHVPEATVG